ncbi:hypothetical protein ACOMHN_010741 [Nucella lapillus]
MEAGKNRRPLTRQRPSRASSVQSAWEREGVDPSIRHLLSLSRRKGTESLYGSRWQKRVRWARESKFDPFSPSRTHLVNLLGHLSTSRSLSSSSVRGYRAAICTTLRQIGGPDFSEDPLLRDLLRGISAANAASPRREGPHVGPVPIKYYWDRTRSLRTTQRRFFISLRASRSKDISAATISRWISQTIRSAYTQAHLDVSSVQPRAHEVRSIATSAAFQYSLSLRDVLEAAYWRSENPFINFYLRDFRAKRADGTKGISFVAASVPVTFPRPAHSGH